MTGVCFGGLPNGMNGEPGLLLPPSGACRDLLARDGAKEPGNICDVDCPRQLVDMQE